MISSHLNNQKSEFDIFQIEVDLPHLSNVSE